jgi:hypothetical protein
MRKSSVVLRSAAKHFDQAARKTERELIRREKLRIDYPPYYVAVAGCCEAIEDVCDITTSGEAEAGAALKWLYLFKPKDKHGYEYWWGGAGRSNEEIRKWLKARHPRVLALLFAADIAEAAGD